MLFDISVVLSYLAVAIFSYFLGYYRNKTDIEVIKNTIKISHNILYKNSSEVFNEVVENHKRENYKNTKLLLEQNKEAVYAINNQIEKLNGIYRKISQIYDKLEEQTELYSRISMLQKIIVKKKKLDS